MQPYVIIGKLRPLSCRTRLGNAPRGHDWCVIFVFGKQPHPCREGTQGPLRVEWGSGAVAVGRACLFPPLSSGGALVARPWLRFHSPLIEPDMRISLHPALGQDLTPSPTARRAQAESDARARRSRRG